MSCIRGRSLRATVISALVALTGTSSVRAAVPAPTASEQEAAAEAKKHFEEGTKAFNLAEFARAVSEFKAAYNLKPDPLLLYNIAQSFRLGGDDSQAALFYKSFLRNMPDAPNRREVEGRIRTLDRHVAEHKKEAAAAALASPPTATGASPAPPAASAAVAELSPPAPSSAPSVSPAQRNEFAGPRPAPALDLSAKAASAGAMATTTSTNGVHQIDLSQRSATETKAAADQSNDRPVYKRWWFWAGIGAVAVVGIAIAANVNRAPSTPLGLYEPTFK